MRAPARRTKPIEYPESDGKPMAESDLHRDWMFCIIQRLKRFFAGQRVYVSGNLLVYYVEGDPRQCFAPDAFVVEDCDPRRRRIFKIWEEGRSPCFALETTSKKTRREDAGKKKQLYAQLGMVEYFLYDPLAEWLKPALQGYHLVGGEYQAIELEADGSLRSVQLGVTFRLENGELAMFETATGNRLLSDTEAAAESETRAVQAEKEAAQAGKEAVQAAKKAAREGKKAAKAEKEAARAGEEAARAEKEAAKATARATKAEQLLEKEAAARKALEEELARLRARQDK